MRPGQLQTTKEDSAGKMTSYRLEGGQYPSSRIWLVQTMEMPGSPVYPLISNIGA